MRILFFSDNFPPESNASASRVYERALYWLRDGHQVTVVTSAPNFPHGRLFDGYENRWRQVEDMQGLRVVRVKTLIAPNQGVFKRTLDFLSFMLSGWFFALFEARPDVVVATSPQFFCAVAGWAQAAVRRRPFVFELGDLWPATISDLGVMRHGLGIRLVEKLELFLYRRAAAVVALTPSFKDNLVARGIPADKISVVINGVDLSRYEPGPRNEALADEIGLNGRCVVGYLGTHGIAHGLSNVIEAARQLSEHPEVAFLFVGAGADREALIREAREAKLSNVMFLPAQPKGRMPEIWNLCDVALVHLRDTPVMRTVIPSKMFEAMGMGRPILMVAPEGEATRILAGEGAGVIVAPEQPSALAAAVLGLAEDRERRQALAETSRQAAQKYSRAQQAERFMRVLEGVVGACR